MKDKIKIISNMAFEAIDADGNGFLEKIELAEVLRSVANDMGVP